MTMKSPRNLIIFAILGGLTGLGLGVIGSKMVPQSLSENQKAALTLEVSETLSAQAAAWNSGDVEAFMADYWQDEALRFASNDSVTRGWTETLERYQRRYPDRGTMGRLAFTEQEIEVLSKSDALVFGRFTLTREADAPTGLYTLHLHKTDGAWVIMSDHTSTAD